MIIIKYILTTFSVTVFFLLLSPTLCGQALEIDSAFRITMSGSDETFPAWSEDGKKLVFQSNKYGNSNIFLYNIKTDTLKQVTDSKANERHPVFISKSGKIAFDSQRDGSVYIYFIDTVTQKEDVIFSRKILCQEPTFSPSGRLLVFKGYDRSLESWQIFSYDLVYDNLNQLTHFKDKKVFRPQLSPNGKTILFATKDTFVPYSSSLNEINWYGEKVISLDTLPILSYCWSQNSFRIITILKNNNTFYSITSLRKDGTSPYNFLNDSTEITTPALSPDGKKLAVAVKFNNDFDIVIFNLPDE